MAYRSNGVLTGRRRNAATLNVSAGTAGNIKTFNPSFTIAGGKGVLSNEYEVEYDHAGNSEGEPMLLTSFAGLGQKGLTTSAHESKFFGICNTGRTSLEIMFKLMSYDDNSGADRVMTIGTDPSIKMPYLSMLLHPNQFISLPGLRMLLYHENQTGTSAPVSAAYGTEGTVALTGVADTDHCTDSNGFCETTDLFGGTDTAGVVPGSIAIQFYTAGYQDFGITNRTNRGKRQTPSTDSGLAANTAHRFKVTVDGSALNIVFTTHTSDTTWGNGVSGNGVLKKINDRFKVAWKSGDVGALPKIHIVKGDIRITSGSRLNTSNIVIAASTTGSEQQMFDQGLDSGLPDVSEMGTSVAAALETASFLDREPNNIDHLLIDNGQGSGSRVDGGIFNLIDTNGSSLYGVSGCTLQMKNCPPLANFSIFYNYNAAHSGASLGGETAANIVTDIFARTVNKMADIGKVKIFSANG